MAASARTPNTGYSSHGCRRLEGWRRECTVIHTTSASSSGGQTHPSAVSAAAPGARTMSPAPVMAIAAAGTVAQRFGRSVTRTDRTANSAHPTANPSRIAPVIAASRPPAKGPATSAIAATRPATSEPATIIADRRGAWRLAGPYGRGLTTSSWSPTASGCIRSVISAP